VHHWRLIMALMLIGGLVAAGVSAALPNVYEAVALVSVTAARTTLRLDSVNQSTTLPVQAYPELARSSDVIAAVFAKAAPLLPANLSTAGALAGQLTAETASDPTLLRLRVRDSDPQRAAQIANLWAEVFASEASQLYNQDQANLAIYQQQLTDAKANLDLAESNLANFQSSNQVSILSAMLDSQRSALTDYLSRQHQLQLLNQDSLDLLNRLNSLQPSAPASVADDLALVSIASRMYAFQSSPTTTIQSALAIPIQLQISAGQPLAGPTVADQKAMADNLRATIAAHVTEAGNQAQALQPKILDLQGQVAAAQLKQVQLTRAASLAQDQYVQLAKQVQQAGIAIQDASSAVQIASRAATPGAAISPHRSTNVVLGAATGLVLGLLVSLALEFWQSSPLALEGEARRREKNEPGASAA
jgi:uncharacterized protein involved in exopolysaccharide biosynthesis